MRRAALVGLGLAQRGAWHSNTPREAATGPTTPRRRLVAIGALAEFDTTDVSPALAHAASDPDEGVRSAAMGSLSTRRGAEASTALVQRVLDPITRRARRSKAIAVNADERIDGVLAALETSDADTAPLLMAALTRMRRPSSQAGIAAALRFENVHARRAAASALVGLVIAPRRAKPCAGDVGSGSDRSPGQSNT